MKKIIIFNWKMNLADFIRVDKNNKAEIVVCPPFTHLEKAKNSLSSKIKLGAQNCFWESKGAYTGEISAKMLKDLGVEYVIIGHSERRKHLNETDEMINKKVKAALSAGLKVILCVGEPEREIRDKRQTTRRAKEYVKKQLGEDLKGLSLNSKSYILNSRLIIAYEPIWAIGTGIPARPEDALEMIKFIKQSLNSKFYILNPKVLYGGSVDSKNIESFLQYKEIDGALVGGASLNPREVKEIIKICPVVSLR